MMELCAGAARGSYLVCIGWTTLIVIGDVAAVGQVFIVAMITTIVGGPITAVIVDRYNRKHLTIIAHLCIATALLSLGMAVAFDGGLSLIWFFLTVVVTIFRNLYHGSHDGLIHANASTGQMVHAIARFRGIHLLATAVGTVLTGIIIEYQSATAGFIFAALGSALLVGVSTIVFSFCVSVISLAMMHAAMGFSVWMCRIIIDGRVPQICTGETVGRTKVYIEVMFSLAAIIMCFSPTLVKLPSTSSYFLFWGIVVVVSTSLLWLRQPGDDSERLVVNS